MVWLQCRNKKSNCYFWLCHRHPVCLWDSHFISWPQIKPGLFNSFILVKDAAFHHEQSLLGAECHMLCLLLQVPCVHSHPKSWYLQVYQPSHLPLAPVILGSSSGIFFLPKPWISVLFPLTSGAGGFILQHNTYFSCPNNFTPLLFSSLIYARRCYHFLACSFHCVYFKTNGFVPKVL